MTSIRLSLVDLLVVDNSMSSNFYWHNFKIEIGQGKS